MQQAYEILLSKDVYCEWKHYRIYSQLMREGYRMFRYKPILVEVNSLKKITPIEPIPKRLKIMEVRY